MNTFYNQPLDNGKFDFSNMPELGDIRPRESLKFFGGKKPHEYNHGDDIHDFLLVFDNYCTVIGLSPSASFKVFCKFLDNKSLSRVMSLNLTDKQTTNWHAAKEMIVKKLDPNYNSRMSVDELFNIKQSSEETILDFAERLEKMINLIPTCKKMPGSTKEELLQDAFINGLRSEQVVYSLLTTPGLDHYAKLVDQSQHLDKIIGKLKSRPIKGDGFPDTAALLN